MIYRYSSNYKWNRISGNYTLAKYLHITIREQVCYHRPWGNVIGETRGFNLSSEKYTYYHKTWDTTFTFFMEVIIDHKGKYTYSVNYKPYHIRCDTLEDVLNDFDFLAENWLFNRLHER